MAKTYDFNPDRGTWYEYEDDPQTGGLLIHTKQDTQPVIDHATRLRNSGVNDKIRKDDFMHYATIPAGVEVELRAKGLNIYNRNNSKRLIKEIETNYPYLKVTNLKHSVKGDK